MFVQLVSMGPCSEAIGRAMATQRREVDPGVEMPLLEEVFAQAEPLLGLRPGQRLPVPRLLGALRRSGGAELAKRVGKLSKRRNQAAHPDVHLAMEVASFLADGQVQSELAVDDTESVAMSVEGLDVMQWYDEAPLFVREKRRHLRMATQLRWH